MADHNIVRSTVSYDTNLDFHDWLRLEPLCTQAATCPVKRAMDVLVATLLLMLIAPLLVVIALLVRLSGPGPILFWQQRSGLDQRVFRIAKFRTMHVLEDGLDLAHARPGDARTTRVGRVLRRLSLDELPQLINIVRGEMSFVGPRPHALAHDAHYGQRLPGYSLRFAVRPGLTGLAQVRGLRGGIDQLDGMADRVRADRQYIENWSLGLDLLILARTAPRLLFDRAAY